MAGSRYSDYPAKQTDPNIFPKMHSLKAIIRWPFFYSYPKSHFRTLLRETSVDNLKKILGQTIDKNLSDHYNKI